MGIWVMVILFYNDKWIWEVGKWVLWWMVVECGSMGMLCGRKLWRSKSWEWHRLKITFLGSIVIIFADGILIEVLNIHQTSMKYFISFNFVWLSVLMHAGIIILWLVNVSCNLVLVPAKVVSLCDCACQSSPVSEKNSHIAYLWFM